MANPLILGGISILILKNYIAKCRPEQHNGK